MKAVMISIQPKWCELIASGEKTIEVRKTKPKLETPFKVYIYETQGKTETPWIDEDGHEIFKGRGQVIGEFVCRVIVYWNRDLHDNDTISLEKLSELSCVSEDDLLKYADGGYLYGWHITDLKIYDKPRELREFYNNCNGLCFDNSIKYKCIRFNPDDIYACDHIKPITRPPMSWMYVEVLDD
jgi:predicted transcriptional regulator